MSITSLANMHHLMSAKEIATLLGISRQRVDRIAKTDIDFPQPVAVLSGIRVFETKAIEAWARKRGRIK